MTSTIPLHAARLWLEDNSIHLDLPTVGSLHSHRLTFPNNAPGLARLLHLVQQRSHESKIGTDGDLTQAQLDKRLKAKLPPKGWSALGPTKVKKADSFSAVARQGARDVLRRLGLT